MDAITSGSSNDSIGGKVRLDRTNSGRCNRLCKELNEIAGENPVLHRLAEQQQSLFEDLIKLANLVKRQPQTESNPKISLISTKSTNRDSTRPFGSSTGSQPLSPLCENCRCLSKLVTAMSGTCNCGAQCNLCSTLKLCGSSNSPKTESTLFSPQNKNISNQPYTPTYEGNIGQASDNRVSSAPNQAVLSFAYPSQEVKIEVMPTFCRTTVIPRSSKTELPYSQNQDQKISPETHRTSVLNSVDNAIIDFLGKMQPSAKNSNASEPGKGEPAQEIMSIHCNFYIWVIKHYRAMEALENGYWSEPFYLGYPGYRMRAKIEFTTHYMGIFIQLLPGDYDDVISWPFRQDMQFIIIDQTLSGKNISRVLKPFPDDADERGIWNRPSVTSLDNLAPYEADRWNDDHPAWGIPDFAIRSMLSDPSGKPTEYVNNDQVYIAMRLL